MKILDWFVCFVETYAPYITGGIIGAIIDKARNTMTAKQFFRSILIAIFVSFCVGVFAEEYFDMPERVIYTICGIAGTFSKNILDELEDIISYFSEAFKKKFLNKTTNEEKNIQD